VSLQVSCLIMFLIHLLIKSPQFFYLVLNKRGCFNFMSYELVCCTSSFSN
jgi:hypothetical protein